MKCEKKKNVNKVTRLDKKKKIKKKANTCTFYVLTQLPYP